GSQLYAGHVSASHAMEDLFRSTGAHVRALSMPGFMDNFLRQVPALANGTVSGTHPADLRIPWTATADIASAAARFLLDHTWTGQDSVGVLGPDDLSLNDIAQILTETLGTTIRFQPGDRTADKRALLAHGFSEAMAQSVVDMDIAAERGIYNLLPRTPENTGPTSFRRFAEEVIKPALAR
ncbi:MAG TPA: NmrA family transcriptional regulator, partial [Humibacter sp.]|nr:NmrA family transcriptional regulator [Humibacter sp.]